METFLRVILSGVTGAIVPPPHCSNDFIMQNTWPLITMPNITAPTLTAICTPSNGIFPVAVLNREETYCGLGFDAKYVHHVSPTSTTSGKSPNSNGRELSRYTQLGETRRATMKLYDTHNIL